MKSADTRPYTEDVDLAELNFSCTCPVEWLPKVVGPKVDGEVQQKLDQIRIEIGRTQNLHYDEEYSSFLNRD